MNLSPRARGAVGRPRADGGRAFCRLAEGICTCSKKRAIVSFLRRQAPGLTLGLSVLPNGLAGSGGGPRFPDLQAFGPIRKREPVAGTAVTPGGKGLDIEMRMCFNFGLDSEA